MEKKPIKIFLVCTGLGHIQRGYETFTIECFEALKDHPELDLFLYKGAGPNKQNEFSIWNVPRNSGLAKFLSKVTGSEAYFIEQLSYLFHFLWHVIKHKPDIIYFSDFIFGTFLWNLRKRLGLKYRLLFSNGAPNGPPFSRCDHVQQLLWHFYDLAVAEGEPKEKLSVVPYGIKLKERPSISVQEKNELRSSLRLPLKKKIIISVGVLNSSHKRMDYLVQEFAQLSKQEYFLLILGQTDKESQAILEQANALLTPEQYRFATVPYTEMPKFYEASDLFVLCSLKEGFGRVYLEALQFGLPIVTHDYPVSREVLESNATLVDLQTKGALAQAIATFPFGTVDPARQKQFVRKYDWATLSPSYVQMIRTTAAS